MDFNYFVHVLSTIYRKSVPQSSIAPRVMWLNFLYIYIHTVLTVLLLQISAGHGKRL